MDQMVLDVQKWVNSNYLGKTGYYTTGIDENGKTGWSTVYALTRALQIELGITNTADSFGPTTERIYKQWGEMTLGSVPNTPQGKKIVQILQGAMYCKGYSPGGFNGTFGEGTKAAVQRLQSDANLPVKDGKVYTHVFKAFLTMDAYVLTSGGSSTIREIQRQLNNRYFQTSGVQPCDGHYQRQTNRALIYGLQTEMGIPAAQQTGAVGPSTRSGLPTLSQGSTQANFIRLLKYALVFNGYELDSLDGNFNGVVRSVINGFQLFVQLEVNGIADQRTWLSLLVSTGDTTRKGTASDCITMITPARAQTLVNEGYKVVGRYLTNASAAGLNKKIQPGELNNIFNAGLSIFPIYQTIGSNVNYFNERQGTTDATLAVRAAKSYGFREGTTIYFAVDFDAYDYQVTSNILPYFRAIFTRMRAMKENYKIGVYGPRNVCIRVSENNYAQTSFVCGMSTGFSGNLGYPLPQNWAFDQISTITIGNGTGRIEIDNNIQSGRDNGVSSVTSPNILEISDDVHFNFDLKDQMKFELVDRMLNDRTSWQVWRPNFPTDGVQIRGAVDTVLNHDSFITHLSNLYGIRKAMIQAVMFSELSLYYAPQDDTVDLLVKVYFEYMKQLEIYEALSPEEKRYVSPPFYNPLMREDSSTGMGQIKGTTAIKAINFAKTIGIYDGPAYNMSNWKDVREVWTNLHEDEEYNLRLGALNLIISAIGGPDDGNNTFSDDYYNYTETQIKAVLSRYNGFGDEAIAYGERVYGLYEIFETYNSLLRN